MKSMKDFYEDYMKWRIDTNYIYHPDRPPQRVVVAVSMIEKPQGNLIRILDAGCGDGIVGKVLREKFGQDVFIVGMDISEKAVNFAKDFYDEAYSIDIETDELSTLLGAHKFDYIVCLELLEHIFDPKHALLSLKDVLKDDGTLIVSFPNFAFYRYRLKVMKGYFPEEQHIYSDMEHLHYFTVSSFIRLLSETGLEPVKIDGEFAMPSFMSFLPVGLKNKFTKAYPNFFGVQLVIKTVKKEKVG